MVSSSLPVFIAYFQENHSEIGMPELGHLDPNFGCCFFASYF
jgi:hypothetical protein